VAWWRTLKGTSQTKQLREDAAAERTQDSIIDTLLAEHGLAWGGNVDGIIICDVDDEDWNIIGIVEKRISKQVVSQYDPADHFYNSEDPLRNDFNTWRPLIMLAKTLNCPLYLLTFCKTDLEHYGYATVKTHINGLQYWTGSPKNHITNNPNAFNNFIKTSQNNPIDDQGDCAMPGCDRSVTGNVLKYCLDHRDRFKGKVYCFKHQQQISKSNGPVK
jgi:hypothetical protein